MLVSLFFFSPSPTPSDFVALPLPLPPPSQEPVGETLEELWISYNALEKLKGVGVLKACKVLYMSNNKVKDWKEFEQLKEMPMLQDLLFVGNPLQEKHAADGGWCLGRVGGMGWGWGNFWRRRLACGCRGLIHCECPPTSLLLLWPRLGRPGQEQAAWTEEAGRWVCTASATHNCQSTVCSILLAHPPLPFLSMFRCAYCARGRGGRVVDSVYT